MRVTKYTGQRTFKEPIKSHRKTPHESLKSAKDLFIRYSLDEIKEWKSLDLYYLMGITQEDSYSYTESNYKDIFRKQARLFHPDRLISLKIEDNGLSFIALTKAHETLSTPHKKRLYDFIAFDESIPVDKEYTPEEFFATFEEVFRRNLIFSSKPCALTLGNMDTKDTDIVSFYRFWQNFDSVRSFEFLCNDEDYQSREMRRHAAQQNKEMLDEKKAEDSKRIRKLVSLAIKHDPRVNKESKSKEKKEITVEADGWKSTETEALVKLAQNTPARTRNRFELIFSALSRYAPSRTKKEVQAKLLKIDAALQKTKGKK